ncbi:MAG: alpha/beta hydrolase [Pseudomonadota bacterium]
MLKWIGIVIGVLALVIAAAAVFGPRPGLDRENRFDDAALGDDLDAYLAAAEADVPNLRPGAEKEIIWANTAAKQQTELAIVYIHGFSATKHEIRPVPDKVAAALGANLYYARLAGHGRDGDAMAEPEAGDWWRDTGEALAIGRRLGRKVVVIGASTGVTMATLALADAEMSKDVIGMIGVAPNYRFKGAPLAVVTAPMARTIVPLLAGSERSWEPRNEEQGKWWTTTYPMVAVTTMGAAVKAAMEVNYGALDQPALFIFSDKDEVVDHVRTREVAAAWGAAADIVTMEPAEGEEPSHHVIAGDITAPSNTDAAAAAMLDWIASLN